MSNDRRSFKALVNQQWLPSWDKVEFDAEQFQSRPLPQLLLLSMPAGVLRQLSDTHRRDASDSRPRSSDLGIQRRHDTDRSLEIARFVRDGYPLSSISEAKRSVATPGLRKPGWLPTAIVINVLDPASPKGDRAVTLGDALRLPDPRSWKRGEVIEVELPDTWQERGWEPTESHPVEIIDGQHRLWSFDEEDESDFDLPVVAFFGLDVSWQAYLFWTINIKPKKINASLAYDMYPLLREQDWLLAGESLDVYRETRSQELTEVLWIHDDSPWRDRINMLGEPGVRRSKPVTQAAFVRSISETFVRSWRAQGARVGGLFGGASDGSGLQWNGAQQGAFILTAWRELRDAIGRTDASWAQTLRSVDDAIDGLSGEDASAEPAFTGPYTLLASDQGVRAFHQTVNAIVFLASRDLDLAEWRPLTEPSDSSIDAISTEIAALRSLQASEFLVALAEACATFDWRNSNAPGLTRDELLQRQALRGTGGYKLLRDALISHISEHGDADVARVAGWAKEKLA